MSLIFCDGFDDDLHATKWNLGSWNGISTSYGRNGRGAFNDSGTSVGRLFPAADQHATMTVGFACRMTQSANGTNTWLGLYGDSATTRHIGLSIPSGTLQVQLSYGPTTTGVIYTFQPNLWYYVELKATLGDSPNGSVEFRVNGTTVFSATNTDTKNGGTGTVFDGFYANISTINPVRRYTNFDDVYICNGAGTVNNTFLNDLAIETVFPNGNGSQNDFVGSDGNSVDNYLLVDEATPNTTDYSGSSTVGARDLYTMANLARTSGAVRGVVVNGYVANSDSGARGGGLIAKSGATVTTAVDTPLSTTWTQVQKVMELDPNTSSAWTVSGINNLELGFEVTS